ncbi:arginine--tRNA ligase [candidate division WOR-3 bacterium]|nr:arginine--tRNA ligase [candidate division WOR-3 bacterium]
MNQKKKRASYVFNSLYDQIELLVSGEFGDANPEVRRPPKESGAQFAVPCFRYAKVKKETPVMLAEKIAERWNSGLKAGGLITRFEPAGGYINVFADQRMLLEEIFKDINALGEDYGTYRQKEETIVVDYCSPNIAKPLTVGHLRSTIIGQALINILKARGYEVVGINFLSDWGTQFGKLLYAFNQWGDENLFEKDPIGHLVDLYVRFHAELDVNPSLEDEARDCFKRLEQGGEEERALWLRFRKASLADFEETVARLGVCFDYNWYESDFEKKAHELIDRLLDEGIAERSQGAVIITTSDDDNPPLVAKKSDGTTLYASRDLASAIERIEKFKPVTKLLYVVATEQNLHFVNLAKALERLGFPGICQHIRFGMVSLPSGKISTREGRVVYLDDLLDEAERRAEEIVKEKNPDMPEDKRAQVARRVGIGAVIYADLSQDRIKDITFDWSKMLAFDGNSAPYLQYAAVRCAKILEKAEPEEQNPMKVLKEEDIPATVDKMTEPETIDLLLHLGRFPQAVSEAAQRYAPHVVAGYLYELATLLSRFYTQVPVLKASDENTRLARLALVHSTGLVLRKGLAILGIRVPVEM